MNVKISGEALFAVVIVVVGGFAVYYFVKKPRSSTTAPAAQIPASSSPSTKTTSPNGGVAPSQNNLPGWMTTVQQVETIAGQAATVIPQIADGIKKLFEGN